MGRVFFNFPPSGLTLMPVSVASFTASSSLSYLGLKVTVKAQSIIRPVRASRRTHVITLCDTPGRHTHTHTHTLSHNIHSIRFLMGGEVPIAPADARVSLNKQMSGMGTLRSLHIGPRHQPLTLAFAFTAWTIILSFIFSYIFFSDPALSIYLPFYFFTF